MCYCFIRQTEYQLNEILSKFNKMETKIATFQEIVDTTRAEQDIIMASILQTNAMANAVAEGIKQLLADNDVAGAQKLLNIINGEILTIAERPTISS